MKNVYICNNPLVEHKLAFIRNKNTDTKLFRETVSEIGALITYEVSKTFKVKDIVVKTPICDANCKILLKKVVIVPILRAGLGMVEGIHNMIPQAKIGHIGLYRKDDLSIATYFEKLPKDISESTVLLVDPMLATGASAIEAVNILKKSGVSDITFVGLVGCPEGVSNFHSIHPDVNIYLAAYDEKLNENGYIVPGLGDCGDRIFGTK